MHFQYDINWKFSIRFIFSAKLIKIPILNHILIAKIEIVLEVSSPSPPTLQKNVNAVALGRRKEKWEEGESTATDFI